MRRYLAPTVLLFGMALAACGEGTPLEPVTSPAERPRDLAGRYEWALDGWDNAARPVGQPTALLTWTAPDQWRGEPFRVYGRRSGSGSYTLIATVTSCAERQCRYADANVVSGASYDYFVAAVDERTNREAATEEAVAVVVPTYTQPPRPAAPRAVALDGLVYLQWEDVPLPGDRIWKYMVFLEERNRTSVFFQPGETDGVAFVDVLAQNGTAYRYSIAVVDVDGHISERSALSGVAIPRPDAQGDLIYAFSDNAQASGFTFNSADGRGRVVAGDSPAADWRLEASGDEWFLRTLGATAVADMGSTLAISCGPGSDAACDAVTEAPLSGYETGAIPLALEHTYVLRLGSGTSVRYAKVRVQILGYDNSDRQVAIFDWAHQTVPGERSLIVLPG